MMNSKVVEKMKELDISYERIVNSWKELIEIESYTHDRESVQRVCNYIENRFKKMGLKTRVHKYEQAGPMLIAEYGKGKAEDGIIIAGHMDTVFNLGFIKDYPFRVTDGKVYGPGVLDMKGGINLVFYILELLIALDYQKPIKIIIAGDEEHGHPNSDQGKRILEESRGYKLAFNMETGLIDGSITVERKGRIACEVITHGKNAHAGANLNDGINAIQEMAHKIIKITELNKKYERATFSVGTIKGGTYPNTVPDHAEIEVDIRYLDVELKDLIEADMKAIAENCVVEGATGETIFNPSFPPFSSKLNLKAFDFVNSISEENGLGTLQSASIGGSSDASFISMAGVPCLCSMGVRGEWNHTNREYALVSSTTERILLITDAILKAEDIKSFL